MSKTTIFIATLLGIFSAIGLLHYDQQQKKQRNSQTNSIIGTMLQTTLLNFEQPQIKADTIFTNNPYHTLKSTLPPEKTPPNPKQEQQKMDSLIAEFNYDWTLYSNQAWHTAK